MPPPFVSYESLMMTKTQEEKDLLQNRCLCKCTKATPKYNFDQTTWEQLEHCHNMQKAPLSQVIDEEYNLNKALVIARVILDIHNRVKEQGVNFAQNYIYQKGVKLYGKKGKDAGFKELDQLHRRNCFTPIDIKELTPKEKAQAMEALMFLTEKKDGSIKGEWSIMENRPGNGYQEKILPVPLQLWRAYS